MSIRAPIRRRPGTEARPRRGRSSTPGALRVALGFLGWLLAGALGISVAAVLAMRWIDPPTSAFILREQWQAAGERAAPIRQRWVDAADIAPSMKLAVIAAEDQQFPDHNGFDLPSIRQALQERARGTRSRGASTLSQQVAKNLFLWPGHSWVRKGLEAYFTVLIEVMWPKARILEIYLNIAEFGHGVFGVGAATEAFYGLPAAQLTAEQAALLAAVLPNPKRLRVDAPSAYVRERQQWILAQMRALGGVSLLRRLQ